MVKVLRAMLFCLLIVLCFFNLAFAIGTSGRGGGGGVGELVGSLVLVVLISIVIFLILREFWCWYWKINTRIDLLKQINAKLGGSLEGVSTETDIRREEASTIARTRECPKCGEQNSLDSKFCEACGSPLE